MVSPGSISYCPIRNVQNDNTFIKRFSEISIDDVPTVGGKNASLGEMFRELSGDGVQVPDGFAITADAYRFFVE